MKKTTAKESLKKLVRSALVFLPVAVLVAAVNLTVDPASLFKTGYEAQVARIVTSGQNASNLKNMDDRVFQKHCADLLPQAPDLLVLGSSRVMQLTSRTTGYSNMFNGGVTNGDLRDMISLYTHYEQQGKRPQNVIIMTDYCMLNPAKLDSRANVEGYSRFARRTGTEELKTEAKKNNEKWLQILSPTYFQSSLEFLRSGLSQELVPTDEYECDTDMRRTDGSYSYGLSLRGQTEEQRMEVVNAAARNVGFTVGEYEPNSETLRTQFELWVEELQAAGVGVMFMLPPLNPMVYEAMAASSDYSQQLALEEYFRDFAARRAIPIFGSYDPAALGLVQEDFYDGLHCSMEAVASFYPSELRGQ